MSLLVGLVATVALAACGGDDGDASGSSGTNEPAGDSATLEFWTWNNEGDYVKVDEAAVARFEAENPGVEVEVVYTPFADYMTKLKAALAAGAPPDVLQVPWDSSFRDLVESEQLEPMSGVLAEGFPAIGQGALDFVSLDEEVWALPLDLNTLQIAYNKTVFDELGLTPPTTADELKAVAAALADADYFGISLGTKDKWAGGDVWFAQLAYTDESGSLLSAADAGSAAWTEAPFVAAGERVADYVAAGVFAPGSNSMGAFNEALDLFASGQAAMFYPVGNFISGGIDAAVAGGFEWGLFPFPGEAGQEQRATGGVARIFSLPRGGENNALAADFLRTLTDSEGEDVLVQYNFIPSWPVEAPSDASDLYRNFLAAQSTARSRTIYTSAVNVALLDGMQAVFDGRETGQTLAESLEAAG